MPNSITFRGLPLPPSSNNQYRSFMRRGRIIHVSSPDLVAYKKAIGAYFLVHNDLALVARESFTGKPLAIHADFGFLVSRLVAKNGNLKRLDVSNRIKACHDAICNALGFDDSQFLEVSARKYAVANLKDEMTTVTISVTDFEEHL